MGRIKIAVPLLILLVFLPFLCMYIYVYPVYDEYWYAFIVQKYGFWGAQSWWYKAESGRYLTTFLGSLNLFFCKNIWAYRIFSAGIFCTFLISLYLFVQAFTGKFFENNKLFFQIGFLLALTFFLNQLPGLSQFNYWLMGSLTYSFGISFLNFFLLFLFFKEDISVRSRYIAIVILALLAFGTSEYAALSVILAYFLYFVFKVVYKKQNIWRTVISTDAVIFILLSVFYLTVVILAPGNADRLTITKLKYPDAGNLPFSIKYGVTGGLKLIYFAFNTVNGWLLFVITVILTKVFRTEAFIISREKKGIAFFTWLIVQIALIAFTFVITISYAYNSGLKVMIPRVLSLPYYLWMMNIMLSAIFLSGIFTTDFTLSSLRRKLALGVCVLLFFLNFFTGISHNIRDAYTDLVSGRVAECSNYYKKQYSSFKNCDIQEVVKQIPKSKPIIYVWDLSEKNYQTRYFGYYQSVLCGNTEGIEIIEK